MASEAKVSPIERGENPARRYHICFVALVVLLIVVMVASVCLGRYPISPSELFAIFGASCADTIDGLFSAVGLAQPFGGSGYYDELNQSAITAVTQVRLPRVLVCAMVGAALSIAGASYQGLFQNPMVSQDVLGASSGAAFGAALAILLSLGSGLVTTMSFAFGLLAVAIAYAISRASKTAPILALILSGMVISALFSSGTSAIKLVADTEEALPAITYWLMGSLASIRLDNVLPTFLTILIPSVPIYLLRWRINLLATGEEEAKSLGMNTDAMRLAVIGCATFLTAACVSVSGLIGWVGLVIPHFCRMILGNDYRRIIPACMVMGAAFLLVVDDIARTVVTSEIPIGILTAFVGAPVFIFLIWKGGARGGTRR